MLISETPGSVLEFVNADIVGPLRKSDSGYEYILTLQDNLSKYVVCAPLKTIETQAVCDAFIKHFISKFGIPKILITDNGKQFVSNLMKAVAKHFKMNKILTDFYHPRSNSIECWHYNLSEYLRIYSEKHVDWSDWLDLCTLCYNSTIHNSTKMTPFECLFGQEMRVPSNKPLKEYEKLPTYKNYIVDLVKRLVSIRQIAHDNLVESKIKSKKYFDQKLNEKWFKVSDKVYLLYGKKPNKLDYPFSGPYQNIRSLGNNNFTIMNLKDNKTQNVNSERLKTYFEPSEN